MTPLDTALGGGRADLAKLLGEAGAVTMARIYNIAATRIQAGS